MDRHRGEPSSVSPYEELEDELLMVQYTAGDRGAFESHYERYKSRAFGYLTKRVKAPGVADELFQRAFLKLHRSRAQYDPKYPFSTWFFTILRNVVIDEFRSIKRRPGETEFDEARFEGVNQEMTSESLPSDLLKALPKRQRDAVKLRFQDDLDFDEIASKLSTSSENVRQLLSRAIRKLRITLGNRE